MLVKYLSNKLLLESSYVEKLAQTASQRYKTYPIPKKSGGVRSIYHPAKELKALQKVIYEDLLMKLPLHQCAYAYKKKVNLHDHAKVHSGAKFLLRMDFKNFFESISADDIRTFINANSTLLLDEWSEDDTELLTKIVCRHSSLTIGSVTSPHLSNSICYSLDEQLNSISLIDEVKYTRYADDLYFSTSKPDVLPKIQKSVLKIVKQLQLPKAIKINYSKTHHSSSKNKMAVTGLVLTNDGQISIGKKKKSEIKSMVYGWDKLDKEKQKYLVGYLSFCSSVEPAFINTLCRKYGARVVSDILKTNLQ